MPRVTSGHGGESFGDGECDVKSGSKNQNVEGHGIEGKVLAVVCIHHRGLVIFFHKLNTHIPLV